MLDFEIKLKLIKKNMGQNWYKKRFEPKLKLELKFKDKNDTFPLLKPSKHEVKHV